MLVSILDSLLGELNSLIFHLETTTGSATPGLNPCPQNCTSPNGDLIKQSMVRIQGCPDPAGAYPKSRWVHQPQNHLSAFPSVLAMPHMRLSILTVSKNTHPASVEPNDMLIQH